MAVGCCENCQFFAQIVAGTKELPYGFCQRNMDSDLNAGHYNEAGNFVKTDSRCEDFKAKEIAFTKKRIML